MAKQTFQGRPVVPGAIQGEATVSAKPLNPTSSYGENIFGGNTTSAPCTDPDNEELLGVDLAGVILCTPQTVGSSMGGGAFMLVADLGLAPKAILFSGQIDAVGAAGILMADIWQEKPIICVDLLGEEFQEAVKKGDPINVLEDGTVEVG